MAMLLVLLTMIWTMPALAWNEPTGFQDFPWGTSERTVKSRVEMIYCLEDPTANRGYRTCKGPFNFGSVRTEAYFKFRRGGLVTVDLRFDENDFEVIKSMLLDQYGGASLEQPASLYWKGRITSIILARGKNRQQTAMAAFTEAKEEEAILEPSR